MTKVRPSSATEETMALPRVAPLSASGNNPQRTALLAGLAHLQAFLLEHPGAPVPLGLTVTVTVAGSDSEQVAFVREVAGQIDAGVEWEQDDRVVSTQRRFGPVTYYAFGMRQPALDEWQAVQVIGQHGLAQLQAQHAWAEQHATNPNPYVDFDPAGGAR